MNAVILAHEPTNRGLMPPDQDRRTDDRLAWATPTLTVLDSREAVRQTPQGSYDDGVACSADGNIACS
jgi:hypothetical protein